MSFALRGTVGFPRKPLVTRRLSSLTAKGIRCAAAAVRSHPGALNASREEDTALPPSQHLSGIIHLLCEFGFDGDGARAICDGHRHVALLRVESLRRRLVALGAAGIASCALPATVTRLPEILTSEKMDRVINFLANDLAGAIDPDKLERLLAKTPPSELAELPEKISLLVDHGVPRDNLGEVVSGVNIRKVFCSRPMEELEKTILILKELGGGPTLILRRPALLNMDARKQLIPRVEFLKDFAGGDAEEAGRLVRKLPGILAYTAAHLREHLDFWMTEGLTKEQVLRVALVYPSMFSASIGKKLARRVEFLRLCGLERGEETFRFLTKAPLFLTLSTDNLAKKLVFLVKLGHCPGTKEMAAAVGAVTRTSCSNLQGTVEVLLGNGLSVEAVLAMSRRHPQVLQYKHEALEEKIEYLVGEMERDVDELLAFPAFLGYKLDDRIKHRFEARKEEKGKDMSLNKLLSVSASRFH